LDREYLEDYEAKEKAEYEQFMKRIADGRFSFETDKFPPDERFIKLQKPVALAGLGNPWVQVPFCGSLIVILSPIPRADFEKHLCKASEIPKVIDFIQETGRLQVVLNANPRRYEGLDYLDAFFKELNPPFCSGASIYILGNEKEIKKIEDNFYTLGKIRYFDFLNELLKYHSSYSLQNTLTVDLGTYIHLRLGRYAIIEEIETLMIDDPGKAFNLLSVCALFISNPFLDLRSTLRNFSLDEIKAAQSLPSIYQPQEVRFPCEIGKFLLKKLTNAAPNMRACYDLIDHYKSYDLQNVQKSLNEAIVTNHSDIISKSAEELSEILDNVWDDPTIPRKIKSLRRMPMSIAAIGSAVSAFAGGLEGFLAGLGLSVGAKFLDIEIEGMSERLVKFFARSYQANVYDFKKKYKDRIVKE
jgi:hypothetical protein